MPTPTMPDPTSTPHTAEALKVFGEAWPGTGVPNLPDFDATAHRWAPLPLRAAQERMSLAFRAEADARRLPIGAAKSMERSAYCDAVAAAQREREAAAAELRAIAPATPQQQRSETREARRIREEGEREDLGDYSHYVGY